MTSTNKLRLGVIGPGIAFRNLHLPQLMQRTDIEIDWLAGTDVTRTQAAAEVVASSGFAPPAVGVDYRQFLTDRSVDGVLVCVPIAVTSEVVETALTAGVNVFAEKPLAVGADRANSLIGFARQQDKVLFVGENFRYQRKFTAFRRLVDEGAIGTPHVYFLNDLHFTPADDIYARTSLRQSGAHSGGYLIDGGTHIVAGLRTMVGRDVELIHALSAAVHPEYLSKQADTLLINIRFSEGLVGHLALGYGVHDRESRTPKVYGTSGTLALTRAGIERWSDGEPELLAEIDKRDDGFAAEWELFSRAISGDVAANELVRADALESVFDLAILEAALTSAQRGAPVQIGGTSEALRQ